MDHSDQCLDVPGASLAENAEIIQKACDNSDHQVWRLQAIKGGFRLQNKNSGKCMDAGAGSTEGGARLLQRTCAASASQTWALSTERALGAWSQVAGVPLVPVAAAVLPNRKVMMWSAYDLMKFGGDNGRTETAIFDPATNQTVRAQVANTGHDMFCPGTAMLSDGRLLVNGGSSAHATSIYNYQNNSWAAAADMNTPRGYNATTALANKGAFTIGGSWSGGRGGKNGELWVAGQGWKDLPGTPATSMTAPDPDGVYRGDNHAWLFAVGGGRVFHAGPSRNMNWYSTDGSGKTTAAGNRGDDIYSMNGNATMYEPGRILKVAGAPRYDKTNALATAYTIDINGGSVNVDKIQPLSFARSHHGIATPGYYMLFAMDSDGVPSVSKMVKVN